MIHSYTRPISRTNTTIAHSELTDEITASNTNKNENAPQQRRQQSGSPRLLSLSRHPLSPLLLELAGQEVVVDHVHLTRAVVIVRVLVVVVPNPVHR